MFGDVAQIEALKLLEKIAELMEAVRDECDDDCYDAFWPGLSLAEKRSAIQEYGLTHGYDSQVIQAACEDAGNW